MINFKILFDKLKKNKKKNSQTKIITMKPREKIEKSYDFIALDFETANNYLNSPCSIGLVAVKDEKIIHQFYSLINPKDRFNKHNTNIHGIRKEDVIDSPSYEMIHNEIEGMIKSSKYVIAHNAQFDMSVLYYVLKKYNIKIPDFEYIDSINFTKFQTPNCGNSLSSKLEYFGLTNEAAHNALADAKATAYIVLAAINKSKYTSFQRYLNSYPGINVFNFKQLNPSKEVFAGVNKFETFKLSEITVSHHENFDESHFLFDKTVVITGNFENYTKKELVQLIVDKGGVVRSGITGKTDVLITGIQDKSVVGADGLSNKQRKANELIANGSNLQLITEDELLKLI